MLWDPLLFYQRGPMCWSVSGIRGYAPSQDLVSVDGVIGGYLMGFGSHDAVVERCWRWRAWLWKKSQRKTEWKDEFADAENRECDTQSEEEASVPRNKVDRNSSTSHYLLCQLCRLTCSWPSSGHGVMTLELFQSLAGEKLNVTDEQPSRVRMESSKNMDTTKSGFIFSLGVLHTSLMAQI